MTTQEKWVRSKLSIIELAEFLKNVSQACRINDVPRQHFYDIKKAYAGHGIEELEEKSCRKSCIKAVLLQKLNRPLLKCPWNIRPTARPGLPISCENKASWYPVAVFAVSGCAIPLRPLKSVLLAHLADDILHMTDWIKANSGEL